MANQILTIQPYWQTGTWVFDDEAVGLDAEPFVEGIPEMITDMVEDIDNARDGFRLLFSAEPFPNYQEKITWVREEMDGNWYKREENGEEGWLCPALFKYYDSAPAEIYAKAEPLGNKK